MLNKRLKNVASAARWRLCTGCGACVEACEKGAVSLVNVPQEGIRPLVDKLKCDDCLECLAVCPGVGVVHGRFNRKTIPDLRHGWGPILEIWEGFAGDDEIRFKGSSGGVATAIGLFCLEREGFSNVLHVGVSEEFPLQSSSVFSKTRDELLECTGSRYYPAAACERLGDVTKKQGNCVFIGKPCDAAALCKSQAVNVSLKEKVGLSIAIFCAGTPSALGTHLLLSELGVRAERVRKIRYRGNGWPGSTTVELNNGDNEERRMSYEQSWNDILSCYVPPRCRLCPDGTGEFADISCGDAWYKKNEPDQAGRSLVLVRTERGRQILYKAMKDGYVELRAVEPEVLAISQKALLAKRRNLFGRLLAMRVMGVPVPRYKGFSLFSNWCHLLVTDKFRSVFGTFRRVVTRGWLRPVKDICGNLQVS